MIKLLSHIGEESFVHKKETIYKGIFIILIILTCLYSTGCNKKNNNNNIENNLELENITTVSPTPTIVDSQSFDTKENATSNEVEITPSIEEVDYSDCFEGMEGCAVFFNSSINTYKIYNKELCEVQASPCSSFKIITTIMGLENGVIESADSTMGYNGTIYPMDIWNEDLTLKDAFRESCIWYFRKVIDKIGKEDVQYYLNQLQYGNCDISEWDGSGINPMPELNGFWLESSLIISPVEQVNVLAKIFDGKSDFSEKNVEILKEVALVQNSGDLTIYGKTGTGPADENGNRNNGWFVGMFDNLDDRYYFAVRLTGENKEVSGAKAKEIAINIINNYFID